MQRRYGPMASLTLAATWWKEVQSNETMIPAKGMRWSIDPNEKVSETKKRKTSEQARKKCVNREKYPFGIAQPFCQEISPCATDNKNRRNLPIEKWKKNYMFESCREKHGVDYRKRGLRKMLDTKNDEKWPLVAGLQLRSRVTSFFAPFFPFHLLKFGVLCKKTTVYVLKSTFFCSIMMMYNIL